jgi:hypothetical protein
MIRFSAGLWCAAAIIAMAAGCSQPTPTKSPDAQATAKPSVPAEIKAAAEALLGSETQVLAFGDLAKTGKQQILAANVVPKTPKNNIPGTIVTRAVVAENTDGKWVELLLCDEHLKNPKGYLGLTPIAPVTGWRLQFEQDAEKGLQMYFTPLQVPGSEHTLPIAVRWNPKTKRYQSMDRTFQNFLLEFPALENARTPLR